MLLTIGVYDDDTGDAIELSGRALANPGNFTGSSWTVTDGSIVTTSTTELTIPDFPIGNQLVAVALTVGEDLDILPGDQITIADPTGLNTMTGYVVSYASSTGALVVQVSCRVDLEIRSTARSHGDGYATSWDLGDAGPHWGDRINAELGRGITLIATGIVQVRIPAFILQRLRPRTYDIGMVIFDGSDTRELFVGKLPVTGGIVRAPHHRLNTVTNPYGLP